MIPLKRKLIISLIIIIPLVSGFPVQTRCGSGDNRGDHTPADERKDDLKSKIILVNERGTVRSLKLSTVGPRIPVKGVRFLVKEGDHVEKGERVMEVSREEAEQLLGAAQTNVDVLEAQLRAVTVVELPSRKYLLKCSEIEARQTLKTLEVSLKAQKKLFEKKLCSQFQLEEAETKYELAGLRHDEISLRISHINDGPLAARASGLKAKLKTARNKLVELEENISENALLSPQSGEVLLIQENVQSFLQKHSPNKDIDGEMGGVSPDFLLVGDISKVIVDLAIFQSDICHINIGTPVSIKADYAPGKVFSGAITSISSTAVPRGNSSIFIVKTKVENPDGILKPGTSVDVTINPGATDKTE